MEVAAGAQPRAVLQEGAQDAFGGAGGDRGFDDHRGVGTQTGGEGARRVGELREVEGAVRAEWRGGADDGGADAAEFDGVAGRPEAPESIRRMSAAVMVPSAPSAGSRPAARSVARTGS